MLRFLILWSGVVSLSLGADALAPRPSLAEPSLSPDGAEIAFVSGGDIWTVSAKGGEAHLLVANPATESRPLYSPDGTRLAFTSTRTGAGDIYVLTLATGQLTRLTYDDVMDQLDGWSPNGQWIYFSSTVNGIGRLNDIFRVNAAGGTPLEVSREPYLNEFESAPSPDGNQIAFIAKGISSTQWWRNGHSHIDETEIWAKPVAGNGGYRRIVAADAKHAWPMWSGDGRRIFYMSDQSGTENIWAVATENPETPKCITGFKEGRLLWPSISHDGKTIVFERGFTIWTLDVKSGKTRQVPISLRGAPDSPARAFRNLTEFTEMALSPDGKKLALIAHGEVFAASAKDGGDAQRVSRTPAAEYDLAWSADSNQVVYASSRSGESKLFEYDFSSSKERQLTFGPGHDATPQFAPDGKTIAYVRDERELHTLSADGKTDKTIAQDAMWEPVLSWSPDSRWIAFASYGSKSFRNLKVVNLGSNAVSPATFLANGETASRIAWSPDGRFILFDTAQRSEPSQIARVDLQPHVPKYREDEFRDLFKIVKTPTVSPSAGSTSPGPTAPRSSAEPHRDAPPLKIDFSDIEDRLTLVPLGLNADSPIISSDGKTLVFAARAAGQFNLYEYSLDELAKERPVARQVTSTAGMKSHYQFTPDSKQLFFLDNGHVSSVSLETRLPKPIGITAGMDVDFDQDKETAFNQAWDVLNRRFFDAKFNGRDWRQLHDEFAPYVAGSRTPDEMRRVVNLMIGELNASHSGISSGPGAVPATPVGRLGLRFDREAYESGKGLMVRDVTTLGPAALEGKIQPGDRLVSINGAPIEAHTNLDQLLENQVDRRVVVEIAPAAKPDTRQQIVLRPISTAAEAGLAYRQWVRQKREYVDRISGGKLGYVHIADMSADSLNQLYLDLDTRNQTKRGVVIDIRNNNGGFVNAYAIDVFTRRDYLTMTPRGLTSSPARPFLGQRALGLPTALVVNESSLSDAEDFTEGYRALKLGKVVGVPTAGWIIYTSGERLIDGSLVRLPEIRVQDLAGQTMEMHPRPVDVTVERKLGEAEAGVDSQLDHAVKILLDQLSGE